MLGALAVVAAPKAVYSAIFLATMMIILAVLYIAQDALFLGMVQVVVYTGAVMMLFLFVLMLIGVDSADSLVETIRGQRVAAIVAGVALRYPADRRHRQRLASPASPGSSEANSGGNVEGLAALIFTRYLWAFELTSALLITAALGAMVLAHRERFERAKTQRELAERAVRARRSPHAEAQPGRLRQAQRGRHGGPAPRRLRRPRLGERRPAAPLESVPTNGENGAG